MADSASFKLNADVSGFKKSIREAQSAMKALDAQSKLAAAQYKASGNAEEYAASKTQLLAKQMAELEKQADQASQAMKALEQDGKQGSEDFTRMQKVLAEAQRQMIELQSTTDTLGNALEEVGQSGSSTANSLKTIDSGIKFQNISNVLDKVDSKLKNILKSAINVGQSIWNWGKEASDWADTLATDSIRYGLDVETLQRYWYAAERIDTSVEDIIKAQDKLMASTKGAEDGIALITQGESQFGIVLKDAEGQSRDMIDVFWDFVDVLGTVGNETDRNAIAQEYFGKSYRDLLSVVEKGRAKWDEAAGSADVVSQENVDKLAAFNDTWQELSQKMQTTRMTLLANLAPAFEKVADALGRMMDYIGEWAESDEGQATMSRLGDAIAGLIDSFAEGKFESLFDTAVGAVEKISEFLSNITGEEMIKSLERIGAIIGGWQLSKTVLKSWSFIKSLGGNAGAAAGGAAGRSVFSLLGSAVQAGTLFAMANDVKATRAEDTSEYWIAKHAPWLSYLIEGDDGWVRRAEGGELRESMAAYQDDLLKFANGKAAGNAELILQYWAALAGGKWLGQTVKNGWFETENATPETMQRAFELLNAWTEMGREWRWNNFEGDYQKAIRDIIADDSAWQQYEESGFSIDFVKNFMNGITEQTGLMTEAGAQMSESVYEGATANIAAAYNAGAALAAAFADGASSVGNGSGGSATYNSEYVNAVNVYGVTNPDQIAAAYREVLKKQTAGYGG